METSAVLGSIVQTIGREKGIDCLSVLTEYFKSGIKGKYSQYLHHPYYDTS